MSQPTYAARVIVLRKTKLGESDLILTMLAEGGEQLRAVAKGARKPRSTFASRLELYSCADVLCAQGRNLDIVKEARLVEGNAALRHDFDLNAAAAPIAELLDRITEPDLAAPKLFALAHAAFAALGRADAAHAPLITVGFILKALAFSGLRPCFDQCAVCGTAVDLQGNQRDDLRGNLQDGLQGDLQGNERGSLRGAGTSIAWSPSEGGVVCGTCARHCESRYVEVGPVAWARALLYARFDEFATFECDERTLYALLQLCHEWVRYHVGSGLKALAFLQTNGNLTG